MSKKIPLSEHLLELADSIPGVAYDAHGNRGQEAPPRRPSWPDDIIAEVHELIGETPVLEAGFGAGPGCVGGKVEPFDPPASIEDGLLWLAQYASVFKAAHLRLENGSVLWFDRWGFKRRDDSDRPAPRPGLEVGG